LIPGNTKGCASGAAFPVLGRIRGGQFTLSEVKHAAAAETYKPLFAPKNRSIRPFSCLQCANLLVFS